MAVRMFWDMHEASPYDFWGIFTHDELPVWFWDMHKASPYGF